MELAEVNVYLRVAIGLNIREGEGNDGRSLAELLINLVLLL